MKTLLIPLILVVLGVAGGTGAGLALRPEAKPAAAAPVCNDPAHIQVAAGEDIAAKPEEWQVDNYEYVKLNNQFVVPVVSGDRVESLVVMSLSVETVPGQRETVYAREPKLRDALLQEMFDHANMGGFKGAFTDGNTLDTLRAGLTETARTVLGPEVNGILIVDIARQDI